MEQPVMIDPNFEPRARVRSNTWPLRPTVEASELSEPPAAVAEEVVDSTSREVSSQSLTNAASAKKGNARRNAWGSSSYAELITNAIQSSPDNRLTLSQIYDWMVQNVPYFKDKGDSNSSAGWKNSIRHNLSLHNRFVRTQNEGAGKSSWWILNPDAKAGKSPRRRAYSMENKDKAMEKKRGRVKKKVEALRATAEGLGSPNSTISENHELLTEPGVHTLQLSPEFRPRTSSNASSCGRISPIRPQLLQDMDDGMSPVSWNRGSTSSLNLPFKDSYGDINLSDMMTLTLADSTVADSGFDDGMVGDFGPFNNFPSPSPQQQQQYLQGYGQLPPPPPYQDQQQSSPLGAQQQQQPGQLMLNTINSTVNLSPDQLSPHQATVVVSSGGQMHQLQSIQSSQQRQDARQDYLSDDVSMYPNSPGLFSHGLLTSLNGQNGNLNGQRSPMRPNIDRSILREALTRPDAPTLASLLTAPDNGPMDSSPLGASCPGDLYELGPMTDWQDLGCDVNEVIKLELKVEGNFDCTFDSINPSITNDY